MIDINTYIQKTRKLGLTDEQIRNVLIEKGWTKDQAEGTLPSPANKKSANVQFVYTLLWSYGVGLVALAVFLILKTPIGIIVLILTPIISSLIYFKKNFSHKNSFVKSLAIPVILGLFWAIVAPLALIMFNPDIGDILILGVFAYFWLTVGMTVASIIVNTLASIFFLNRIRRAKKIYDKLNV